MTIIYIRHGKDRKSSYVCDEKLSKESRSEIEDLAEKLVEEYGVPNIIYYSPFHRTYKTAKYMKKKIQEKTNQKIHFKVEPRLGRFFNKHERTDPKIRKSTYQKGAITDEIYEEFKNRIELQMNTILKKENKIIWNITHSLVILHIAKLNNIKRNKHVEFLDTVIL